MSIETTYVVIDTDDITINMLNESTGNENSYRKSLDGSKAILSFNTKYPNSMAGKVKYTHTEILQFLSDNSTDWEP